MRQKLPKETGVIICSNPKCQRKIEEPILLNLPLAERYYACPHCFMKLDVDTKNEEDVTEDFITQKFSSVYSWFNSKYHVIRRSYSSTFGSTLHSLPEKVKDLISTQPQKLARTGWKTHIKLLFIIGSFSMLIMGVGNNDATLALLGASFAVFTFIFGFTDLGQTTTAEASTRWEPLGTTANRDFTIRNCEGFPLEVQYYLEHLDTTIFDASKRADRKFSFGQLEIKHF